MFQILTAPNGVRLTLFALNASNPAALGQRNAPHQGLVLKESFNILAHRRQRGLLEFMKLRRTLKGDAHENVEAPILAMKHAIDVRNPD